MHFGFISARHSLILQDPRHEKCVPFCFYLTFAAVQGISFTCIPLFSRPSGAAARGNRKSKLLRVTGKVTPCPVVVQQEPQNCA